MRRWPQKRRPRQQLHHRLQMVQQAASSMRRWPQRSRGRLRRVSQVPILPNLANGIPSGASNGLPSSDCDANCHKKKPPTCPCETCNPNPFFNKCTITTSCITTTSGNDFCACRAGYRANGLSPTDPKQWRLKFPGQEYRVFTAPGVDCDTLCTNPFPGPDSCQEVPVRDC